MRPEELRAITPALAKGTYLNFGAHGPSPRPVVEAAQEFLAEHEYDSAIGDDPYEAAYRAFDAARDPIATLLGCESAEIALVESTTAGINAVANAVRWEPGDVVVRTDLEHPAGILPWRRLAQEGVKVRVVETTDGRIDRDAFATAVSDARLACFSALTWTHGTRLPVGDLVEIAHDAGALALVDAVQVPGHVSVDVSSWNADVVAAAGHKWLLGLWGAGFMYVNQQRLDAFEPRTVGYRSVADPTAETVAYHPNASRFEVGSANPAPHVALAEAIRLIENVGLERIEERIQLLARRLIDGIPAERLLSPAEPESGLVTIDVPDPTATVERCHDADVAIRELPYPDAVRASVHAVNTEADIDRLLGLLEPEW